MSLVAKILVVVLLLAFLFVVAVVKSPEKPEQQNRIPNVEKRYEIMETENITAAIAPLPEGSSLLYLLVTIPLFLLAKPP